MTQTRLKSLKQGIAILKAATAEGDGGPFSVEFIPDTPGVYFMQSSTGGPIKIGQTDNLEKRTNAHIVNAPVELVVKAYIEHDEPRKLEKRLHQYFRHKRIRGEWFDITAPDLLAGVKACIDN